MKPLVTEKYQVEYRKESLFFLDILAYQGSDKENYNDNFSIECIETTFKIWIETLLERIKSAVSERRKV